jgi:putative membrane protein
MYGDHGWGWGWLAMVSMTVFWLAVLAGLVWLVVTLARADRQAPSVPEGRAEAPEQILARQFASGEIDADEYTAALEQLDRAAGR